MYTTSKFLKETRARAEAAYSRGSGSCLVSALGMLALLDEISALRACLSSARDISKFESHAFRAWHEDADKLLEDSHETE